MDFRTAVIDSLDRLIASDKITEMLDKTIAKTVESLIDSELRSYSDFGKQLEAKVKEAVKLNGELDLPSYNDAILKIVRLQVATRIEGTIQQQVAANLAKLLEAPPAEIKLSELHEKFVEEISRDGEEAYGEFTFGYDESETSKGFRHVWMDEDAGKSQYSCDIRMSVRPEGNVFALHIGGRDTVKDLFTGPIYGFEELLFQMKVAGTKLIFDLEPGEIETTFERAYDG